MADPLTTVGLAAVGASLSKDLITKILGPSADYIGEELKESIQRGTQNLQRGAKNLKRIVQVAHRKLGKKIELKGSVHPRVLGGILHDGQFCEDELGAEYFGGILASSRSESSDDRALPYLQLIQSSSTSELRMHYLFYSLIRRLFFDITCDFDKFSDRSTFRVYIPHSMIISALDIPDNDALPGIIDDCTFSLSNHSLIDSTWAIGSSNTLKQQFGEGISESGVVYQPSLLGTKLFLWVHNYPDVPPNRLLSSGLTIEELPQVPIGNGAIAFSLKGTR